MEITISSDVFGLSSTKHLHRNAVLHPGNDVVMMWWFCHLISCLGVGLSTSDLTQCSGLITRIASDLCRAHQKYPCTVWSIIGLWQYHTNTGLTASIGMVNNTIKPGGSSCQTPNNIDWPKPHYWHYSHTPLWHESSYQFSIFNLSLKKMSSWTCLVNTSATWSLVEQYSISMKPSGLAKVSICFQKWWYLIAMRFVLGMNFGLVGKSIRNSAEFRN